MEKRLGMAEATLLTLFLVGLGYGSTACMFTCMPFLSPILLTNSNNQLRICQFVSMMIGSRNTGLENFVVATAYDLLDQPEKTLYHLNIAVEKNYPIEEILETPLLEKKL